MPAILRNCPARAFRLITVHAVALLVGTVAVAVSPAAVEQGRKLFEQDWPARNPVLGSDGLGPLFNARSCVACHHQAGVGGGGEAEFNATTVGIERFEVTGGDVDNDVIAKMVGSFHPGFVQSDGSVINTYAMAHHGGTSNLQRLRSEMLSRGNATYSVQGGPQNPEESRRSTATPIQFFHQIGRHKVTLTARLFHRNTTALFGAGLIDQIPDRLIKQHAKAQESHPEISGRPATLDDGQIGKFGWRANVGSLIEFNDQACANEVGLETRRKKQARDPFNHGYRNPSIDIADEQIERLNDFVASLPAPVRQIPEGQIPEGSEQRLLAERGQRAFTQIGCNVCHVPDMGPAQGVYSDILLHDMGYEMMDLNGADPYIVRVTPTSNVTLVSGTQNTSGMRSSYYGRSAPMSVNSTKQIGEGSGRGRQQIPGMASVRAYRFDAHMQAIPKMRFVPLGSKRFAFSQSRRTSSVDGSEGDFTVRTNGVAARNFYLRVHYESTRINQEWRTPPLWGVADSAPYMHDGRAANLLEAVAMHDGEAAGTRDRFLALALTDRLAIVAFLKTMVAPQNVPQASL